jgi:hypothetical protein
VGEGGGEAIEEICIVLGVGVRITRAKPLSVPGSIAAKM